MPTLRASFLFRTVPSAALIRNLFGNMSDDGEKSEETTRDNVVYTCIIKVQFRCSDATYAKDALNFHMERLETGSVVEEYWCDRFHTDYAREKVESAERERREQAELRQQFEKEARDKKRARKDDEKRRNKHNFIERD